MSVCGQSLFGTNNYMKFGNGGIFAVEGSSIAERLMLDGLRIPYKQLLKSRIVIMFRYDFR